jgi:NAD(P)-dependent dehydrogenase (short-subunit alcohol dehydrogenase family)
MEHPTTVIIGLGLEIGFSIARRFHDAGHGVVVVDSSARRVEKAIAELPDAVKVEQYEDNALVHNALATAETEFGRIDHLILIPKIAPADELMALDPAAFREWFDKTLLVQAAAMQAFAKRVSQLEKEVEARAVQKRQRGSITVVLSLAAHLSQPGQFTATVFQGAAEAMTRTAALELAPQNIRVNAISALRPRAEKREGSALLNRTPLGRTASGDEIAEAAYFLASDKVAIITGETLLLDGGRSRLSGTLFTLGSSSET